MHPKCILKRLAQSALAVLIGLEICGCQKKPADSLTLGRWISLVVERAGIAKSDTHTPYFMNIPETSDYFSAVQSAVEWNVLTPTVGFDPSALLTREWAAFTLMNLSGMKADTALPSVKDAVGSPFQRQIELAVSAGLMKTDQRDCFCPKEVLPEKDALALLDQVVSYINDRSIDQAESSISWKEGSQPTEAEPESFDSDTLSAVFPAGSDVQEGKTVHWQDQNGTQQYYQVEKAEEKDGKTYAQLKQADLTDQIESTDIQDSFKIDFSQAEIMEDLPAEETPESFIQPSRFAHMRIKPYEHSLTFQGYQVQFRTTSAGFKAEISRQGVLGSSLHSSLSLNNVRPSFRWKMNGGTLEDCYFKVDFTTEETIGIQKSDYRKLYGDFSRISPADFLATVGHLFQPKKDAVDLTIPLCRIRIPVPGMPLFQLMMQLELRLFASGRAELELSQNHCLGMEIRNNAIRYIRENSHTSESLIRADVGIVSGIRFGLDMAGMTMADILVSGGAKASAAATVHLYGQDGKKAVQTDLPADLIDALSQGNPDVLVCADLKAYWLLNMTLNSAKSLAGRLHLSADIPLLNESNASLIPGSKRHLENWQFVDRCTRGQRPRHSESAQNLHPDKIRINDYSFALNPNEERQIQILAIPNGYTAEELIFSSSSSRIAEVNAKGLILAHEQGNAIITVQTKDRKFSAHCSILVRGK